MREDFRLLLSDRVNRYGLGISTIVLLVGFTMFAFKVWDLPPLVPIFYHRPWGEPQFGLPFHLPLVLLGGIGVLIINVTLARAVHKTIILLARTLIWVSVLVSLLATIAVLEVLFLVA